MRRVLSNRQALADRPRGFTGYHSPAAKVWELASVKRAVPEALPDLAGVAGPWSRTGCRLSAAAPCSRVHSSVLFFLS